MIKTLLRRTAPFLIIIVAVIAAKLLIATKAPPEQKSESQSLPNVKVQPIVKKDEVIYISSYGLVTPKTETRLVSEVKGRLIKLSPKFVAGGVVDADEELAVIEPSDYEADLAQANAELAQAEAALEQEIALGEVAKNDWKGYKKGEIPKLGLRLPQRKQAEAAVAYAKAAKDRAKRNLERTTIRAPFASIVKNRSVDLGQYITIGAELGDLYATNVAEVRLPVGNNQLGFLTKDTDAKVILSTTVADKVYNWDATISRNEGIIDPDSRMFYLVAMIKDPYLRVNTQQDILKYGTFVNAKISGKTLKDVIKLPNYMVRGTKVSVVTKLDKIAIRDVVVAYADKEFTYLSSGFEEGDRLVTNIFSLRQDQNVHVMDGQE